jgi:hypothetical protein
VEERLQLSQREMSLFGVLKFMEIHDDIICRQLRKENETLFIALSGSSYSVVSVGCKTALKNIKFYHSPSIFMYPCTSDGTSDRTIKVLVACVSSVPMM